MNELTILTIGLFVILFVVVIVWSPLARGLVKESVAHPNEPCTLNESSDRRVSVDRGSLPEKPQNTGDPDLPLRGAESGSRDYPLAYPMLDSLVLGSSSRSQRARSPTTTLAPVPKPRQRVRGLVMTQSSSAVAVCWTPGLGTYQKPCLVPP